MTHLLTTAAVLMLAAGSDAAAQTPQAAPQKPAPAQDQAAAAPDQPAPSDRAVNAAQPDFTIIGLPTTLRMPKFASAFRVTHRFTRSLGSGSFGDLAGDFFGFDAGAQIGLEYRFGILPGTQIGIHRTSDKTIQFFAQHHLADQGQVPVGIDVFATAEGRNNFKDNYSPGIGVVLSRTFGRHGAIYAHPMWINNTSTDPSELVDDNSTFILGLGARVRVRPTLYLVAEAAPRTGFDPGAVHASFGIEKRAGGHSFQINFSNGFGTTMAQIARGGVASDTWFIGFNISRKFF
jgi:hypothetical protein